MNDKPSTDVRVAQLPDAGENRHNLTRAQADYLKALKADADRAADLFATALNAIALAYGDRGSVAYDFGAEPFVEVRPQGTE